MSIPGRDALYYGSRCDRYNVKKEKCDRHAIPDLFAQRQAMLMAYAGLAGEQRRAKAATATIGIPLAMTNYQLLPFWGTMFRAMGLDVVVSSASNKELVDRGVEAVLSTPCFPIKVAHGHVLDLIEKKVDYIWLPSITGFQRDFQDVEFSQPCPYVQALPYPVAVAVEGRLGEVKLVSPPVRFDRGVKQLTSDLLPFAGQLGVSRRSLRRAVEAAWKAQGDFEQACRDRGREVLQQLESDQRVVVIVSRPYNGCDPGVSLNLPGKLRKLGVLPIPMDFFDLGAADTGGDRIFEKMYWRYGQRILRTGRVVRNDPRLHAIYLSNFGCGPDSFLISYFKRLMAPKASLVLEIDEHSADAGVVTRLEAFLESLNNAPAVEEKQSQVLYPRQTQGMRQRTVYVPWMGDHAYGLAAAMRACQQPAEVMPLADDETLRLGRRACTGKECLPCIITVGDMIKVTRREDFDPERAAFFMPGGSGPCRFGQYNCLHRMILSEQGYPQTPVFSLSHDNDFYDECGKLSGNFARLAWLGICACDVLQKVCLARRPYEKEPGRTDGVYERWVKWICHAIESGRSESDVIGLMRYAAEDFAAIPSEIKRERPRIGVVGEIYVRSHRIANNDLIRQLEHLGAEVSVAGFGEWIYYSNWTRDEATRENFSFRQWLSNKVQDQVQRKIERRLAMAFESLLGRMVEPPVREILKLGAAYIDPSFQGEAILSVGKMIEFHQEGCHGVVNVMPFSCMPSTIVGGVMKKLGRSLEGMPTLCISYDGQQDSMLQTRLEAFIHQARAYQGVGVGTSAAK